MITYITNLNLINQRDLEGFFVGWRKPLTKAEHYQILKNSQFIVLAIDHKTKQVVGFINALSDLVSYAFIPMLEVIPEYQNQGIGSELMNRMLSKLSHISNIDLSCDEEMISFYQKFNMIQSNSMLLRKFL